MATTATTHDVRHFACPRSEEGQIVSGGRVVCLHTDGRYYVAKATIDRSVSPEPVVGRVLPGWHNSFQSALMAASY